MNNGETREFRRGEVYWRMYGEGYISQAHRPALIVSSDFQNERNDFVLAVAMGSANGRYEGAISPIVAATGRESTVFCNQIECVSKDKLKSYMCSLTDEEMGKVDSALNLVLALSVAPQDDPEKLEMAKNIAVMKKQIENHKDEKTSVEVERDMYKRLYDKALDELCALKMGRDMATKAETPAPEVEKEAPVVEPPAEESSPEVELVDINGCNGAALRNIGCMPGQIKEIIDNRPYKRVEDLKSLRMMNKITWAFIKHKICCIPVAEPEKKVEVVEAPVKEKSPERVNVNEASAEDLVKILGMGEKLAERVIAYRRSIGRFEKLKDLLNVPYFGKMWFEKYAPKLEV